MWSFWQSLKFWERRRRVTAVDVGAGSIKVLEVGFHGCRPVAFAWGSLPTPVPRGGEYWEGEAVAGALARALDEFGVEERRAVATVGAECVFLRILRTHLLPGKKLAKAVLKEARALLPFPLEEAVLRYEVLGTTGEGPGGGREAVVLLAALPAGVVRRHYETFLEAGLLLQALELQYFSLWRALFGARGGGSGAVLHIGCRTTQFMVVREGRISYARTIAAGGDLMTGAVAETCGLSREEAWQLVEGGGVLSLEDGAAARQKDDLQVEFSLREGLSALLGEVSRTVELYNALDGATPVNRVILSGGVSTLKGIDGWLGATLEVPVEICSLPPVDDGRNGCGQAVLNPSFAVVLGTALRGVI